jgi:predicted alpha/beta-hydrolase family hydrolase
MTKVPVNGIEIDYQEYGEGDEVIVFAHGAGGKMSNRVVD